MQRPKGFKFYYVISHLKVNNLFQKKICQEFPAEDEMDQKVWKFLTWTAVGLGLATAASFFSSR